MHFECLFPFRVEGQPADTLPDLRFPLNHITELPLNFSLKNTAAEEAFRRETETIQHQKGTAMACRALTSIFLSFEYFCTAEEKKKKKSATL